MLEEGSKDGVRRTYISQPEGRSISRCLVGIYEGGLWSLARTHTAWTQTTDLLISVGKRRACRLSHTISVTVL